MSDGFLDDAEEEEEDEAIDVEPVDEDEGEEDYGTHAIEPAKNEGVLTPAGDLEAIKETYDQFERIKSKLLNKGDRTKISGNLHINKSGWRKIATAFNVSVETVKEEKVVEDGIVKYTVRAVATAPNGKTASGTGMCASNESNHMDYIGDDKEEVEDAGWSVDHEDVMKIDGKWRRLKDPREVNEHNILATAATRAKNRAISDLVGGGEVSAEEMTADDFI